MNEFSIAKMVSTISLVSQMAIEDEAKDMLKDSLKEYFDNKSDENITTPLFGVSPQSPVIAWWSGGADSALVCWLCLKWFGNKSVRIVGIDTNNEDEDTYRFKKDCEAWYGQGIEVIKSADYENIEEVWDDYKSLNVATGAICSTVLKRLVRQNFQMRNAYSYQAFGFDLNEPDRAINMQNNYPDSRPIFPLIIGLYKKGDALKTLLKHGIEPPRSYRMGYQNNNCLRTGCVQGGVGYWQKYKIDFPDRFKTMAERERRYSEISGKPVTICKDQSKSAKKRNGGKSELVFLEHNPAFPNVKNISMLKGRMPEPLIECNGFCSVPSHSITI